jgi:hypothetical protein
MCDVGSAVLTAVVTKRSIFWDIMPCSPLRVSWRFGEACHLYLQVEPVLFATWFHAHFLIWFFFDSEERGDMVLRNVRCLSTDYIVLCLRSYNSSKMFEFHGGTKLCSVMFLSYSLVVLYTQWISIKGNSQRTYLDFICFEIELHR